MLAISIKSILWDTYICVYPFNILHLSNPSSGVGLRDSHPVNTVSLTFIILYVASEYVVFVGGDSSASYFSRNPIFNDCFTLVVYLSFL